VGEQIVGIEAAGLLMLAILGPILWWPGRRQLRRGFSVTFGAGGYRGTRELHRVAGVIVAVVLITIATTGMLVVWRTEAQSILPKSVPLTIRPAPKVAVRADMAFRPVDDFVARAHAKFGDSLIKSVRFPGGHGRVVAVYLQAAGTTRPRATDQIWFNRYTGEQLGIYEAAALPAATTFLDWMLPIHSGQALGVPGRVLFLICGLTLTGLSLTGVLQWLLRRRLERHPAGNALEVIVARAWEEAPRVRAIELRAANGHELPPFTAGAHVDVHLPNGLIRQYSIWSDPADRTRYCIAVLREEGSRGGSIAIHALRVGARLQIGAPRNSFPLHDSPATSVLIAGGIGITPILAMAAQLARSGRPFQVHYCARRRSEAAFVTRLTDAVATAGALSMHFGDEPSPGRFDVRLALSAASEASHVYICGPQRLIEAVQKGARALGWSPDRVHAELFQPAQPPVDSRPFELHLQRSGRTLQVPADRTVLDVLDEVGISVPSSCRQGLCGTCATTVLEGTPEHHDRVLTASERTRGKLFTPCCSRSRTPRLVLDL
jgi:vanillate O-demethylase ferredoxin subunit